MHHLHAHVWACDLLYQVNGLFQTYHKRKHHYKFQSNAKINLIELLIVLKCLDYYSFWIAILLCLLSYFCSGFFFGFHLNKKIQIFDYFTTVIYIWAVEYMEIFYFSVTLSKNTATDMNCVVFIHLPSSSSFCVPKKFSCAKQRNYRKSGWIFGVVSNHFVCNTYQKYTFLSSCHLSLFFFLSFSWFC